MTENNFDWHDIVNNVDPVLGKKFRELSENIIEQESEIPKKYKELILMACLATSCTNRGTRHRGYEAMHQGATDKEILEALALASLAAGFRTLSEGVGALSDQFTIESSPSA